MHNYNSSYYDFRSHGDRRKVERRNQPLDRRGILRWDPLMKERRSGKDRRAGAAGMARGW